MVTPAQLKSCNVVKRKFGSIIYQSILQAMRAVAKLEGMLVMHCMTNALLEYQFYL